MMDHQIGIIGAGLAGLTVAYNLTKNGMPVTIFEATDRIGGRVWTKKFPNGQIYEVGGEFIDSGHHDIINLVLELNLELISTPTSSKPPKYMVVDYDQADLPLVSCSEASIIADYKKVFPQIRSDKLKAWPGIFFNPENKFAIHFDHMTLEDYINTVCSVCRSDNIGYKSRFAQLLKVAYAIEYGIDCKFQSALNLIFLMGFGSIDKFSWYGPSDEIYKVKYGTERIIDSLKQKLSESGLCEIKLGCPIIQITKSDMKYILTDLSGTNRFFDTVVSSIPFPTYVNIDISEAKFSPLIYYLIQGLKLGSNSKLHVQFEKKFWLDNSGGYVLATHTSIQNLWDCTPESAGENGILVSYNGGTECRFDLFETDLGKIYSRTSKIIDYDFFDWVRHKWSLGAYASYGLGQCTDIGICLGLKELNQNTNFYFVGDAVADIHSQGHMNGSVATAVVVADQIMKKKKLKKKVLERSVYYNMRLNMGITQSTQSTNLENYWTGPHGVLVPNSVDSVVAEDGTNTLRKSGQKTKMMHRDPIPTEAEYKLEHATLGSDGRYYWKPPTPKKYWIGPHGILVPDSIDSVIAEDGCNDVDRNGSETKMCPSGLPPSETEYKMKYTTLGPDGKYYWKS